MSKRNTVLQVLQGDMQELIVMTCNGLRAFNGSESQSRDIPFEQLDNICLVPVRDIQIKNGYVKPQPLLDVSPQAQSNALPAIIKQFDSPVLHLFDGRPLTLMPFDVRIRF